MANNPKKDKLPKKDQLPVRQKIVNEMIDTTRGALIRDQLRLSFLEDKRSEIDAILKDPNQSFMSIDYVNTMIATLKASTEYNINFLDYLKNVRDENIKKRVIKKAMAAYAQAPDQLVIQSDGVVSPVSN